MQDPFFKAAPVNLIDVVSKSAGNIYPSGKYDVFPKIVLLTNHETLYNLDIVLSCHPPFEPIIALFTITGLWLKIKVSKGAKIRNRYNQVPHLAQDTNGKVTNSQLDTTNDTTYWTRFGQEQNDVSKYNVV